MGSGQSAEEKAAEKAEAVKWKQQFEAERQQRIESENKTKELEEGMQGLQHEVEENSKRLGVLDKTNRFFEGILMGEREDLIPKDALKMIERSQGGNLDVKEIIRTLLTDGEKRKEALRKDLKRLRREVNAAKQDPSEEDDASGEDAG